MITPETTLDEWALNPDGVTYHGAKLVQWLYYCSTGKQLSFDEAQTIVDEAKDKKRG